MGVLNDYFRAPTDDVAAAVGERIGGPLTAGASGEPALDGIAAKGIDAPVVLGQLVAFRRGEDWRVDLIAGGTVYPAGPQPDAATFASLPEDSPWMNGPWIDRLGDDVRDDLAAIDPGEIAELGARWATIEEFGGSADETTLRKILSDLVVLA